MTRRRKRQRPDNPPPSLSKRLRPPPEEADGKPEPAGAGAGRRSSSPSLVTVTGLPVDCTVLELKSRLEMYGPISRIRIDVDGSGYVAFRSDHSAEAAISASLDPAFGIAIRSKRVLVVRARDPLPEWRVGVGVSPPSKLLRAEIPLSRHGRSNKKLIAGTTTTSTRSGSDLPYKGREIIAYDDLL
ncbi:hypothetical protein COCNU_14G012840 [Cocos nucifera]|uniref:RRM domain-containing protein n=1 Tax=Cocos nucifera TaxID=13894 RepID=A0A8K0NCG3_COCNU|nr:hypothetical protein COCNU_14G012840 [Cocos nucifera]